MSAENSKEGDCTEMCNTADEFKSLADNQTLLNLKSIHCRRCGSKVVRESVAILTHDKKVGLGGSRETTYIALRVTAGDS